MSVPSIINEAASIANVLNVVVLAIGYFLLVKLYREWVGQWKEQHAAGGRPQVVVAADYSHLPRVNLVVRNFTKAPAREVAFDFSAPVKDSQGFILSDMPFFEKGLPFLEPEGEISCYWDTLPALVPMLREKGLENGIRVITRYKDLAGESYKTEWHLNPLLFEGGRLENSRGMDDLVGAVERLADDDPGQNGHRNIASTQER